MTMKPASASLPPWRWVPVTVAALALAGSLVWGYWPTLATLARVWAGNPHYSHGYLVVLFAVALLWLRRARAGGLTLHVHPAGLALLALAQCLRLGGAWIYFEWLDQVSLIVALLGMALLVGGRRGLTWAWPAVAFLLFMNP